MTLNRGFLFAVLVVVAAAELVGNASAATYIVGDTLGWTVPPSPAAYATWASRHAFRVGDVLVFNYATGFHDVAHVTKAAYDGCSSNNPIALATVGPSNFTLGTVGEDYYTCTFGTHCSIGQKLAINVTSAPSSIAPAPSPPPATTPSPSPSTAPTPTMPPSMPPSPSTSPSGAPSPGSPMPNDGTTSPPAPASESSPDGGPPSAPSSATIDSVCAPLIVFASVVFALVI